MHGDDANSLARLPVDFLRRPRNKSQSPGPQYRRRTLRSAFHGDFFKAPQQEGLQPALQEEKREHAAKPTGEAAEGHEKEIDDLQADKDLDPAATVPTRLPGPVDRLEFLLRFFPRREVGAAEGAECGVVGNLAVAGAALLQLVAGYAVGLIVIFVLRADQEWRRRSFRFSRRTLRSRDRDGLRLHDFAANTQLRGHFKVITATGAAELCARMLLGHRNPFATAGAEQVATLVRDALGDAHEHVFEVDLFFLEHLQPEAVLDEPFGDEAAVGVSVAERDLDRLAFRRGVRRPRCRSSFRASWRRVRWPPCRR